MKKLFLVILLIVLAVGVSFVSDSFKPKLLVKVQVTSEVLRVTNGNDTEWNNATITLNDAFDGPTLIVPGSWPPNETKELPLTQFTGRLNKQPFKPGFEKVREVIIDVNGFQLATRK